MADVSFMPTILEIHFESFRGGNPASFSDISRHLFLKPQDDGFLIIHWKHIIYSCNQRSLMSFDESFKQNN
jgi:hypothetical protein